MTDGRSNVGETAPRTAAAAARALGVKIHTIGIGAKAPALFPVADPLGGVIWREVSADLDETALREIAAISGGSSFRAEDAAALRSVFQEIDRLEKRSIEEKHYRNVRELFPPLLLAALLMILLSQTLHTTWLRGNC
jgi:Ca-activated chloride channel family protein